MIRLVVVALSLASFAACSTNPPPPESVPKQEITGGLAGTWTSAFCGDRGYERRITFAADGSFTAEDRVAPCPPTARCVWSGIVIRRGKYAVTGNALQLAPESAAAGPGQPLPPSLEIDATGVPVEVSADGRRCPYARMP